MYGEVEVESIELEIRGSNSKPPRSAEFPNSAASLYREFATRIVAVRQDVMCRN